MIQNGTALGRPLAIECAGETICLLPEHAVWWPAARVLWVADLHLGKAATFRALGQPVPSGTTRENLARLSALLDHYQPVQLVFLGDFLHAPQARTPSALKALATWRERHSALPCILVRGNHDSRAGDPPAALEIQTVDEPWPMDPFVACHYPQQISTGFVIAGHLHPALTLRGPGRDRLRLACFSVEPHCAVLPAFGEFTGGWQMAAQAGRRLYAVGGQTVWRVPEPR